MNVPSDIDPLGTGGALPPGYERVESVLKPAGAYWQTEIPIETGYRVEADLTVTGYQANGEVVIFSDNTPPTGNRCYYFYFGVYSAGVITFEPSRYGIIKLSSLTFAFNQKVFLSCDQADSFLEAKVDDSVQRVSNLNTIYKSGFFYLGAATNSSGGITATSSFRIYSFKVFRSGSQLLLAKYAPFRKLAGGEYVYGLYDVANRKELPLAAGTILQ